MTARRRPSRSLSVKTAELAFAVPQVVAHRLLRMANAGVVTATVTTTAAATIAVSVAVPVDLRQRAVRDERAVVA